MIHALYLRQEKEFDCYYWKTHTILCFNSQVQVHESLKEHSWMVRGEMRELYFCFGFGGLVFFLNSF